MIRRGSRPNRVVECPFWAVYQGKAGVQPWVVSVVPFVQVRPPSTHNRLLLCSIDALGQLQRWKQCEWSNVRAIAPAPHMKEAAQAFLLRFKKQLLGKGPKRGKRGARPDLMRLGTHPCRARAARSSRLGAPGNLAPRPPPRRQHKQRKQRETGGGREGGDSLPGGGKQAATRATEGGGGRPQDGAGGAHQRARRVGAEGEGPAKAEGGVAAAAVRHGASACSCGGGGVEGGADPDHVLYLQAVELHSALSAQRHVSLNMGGQRDHPHGGEGPV